MANDGFEAAPELNLTLILSKSDFYAPFYIKYFIFMWSLRILCSTQQASQLQLPLIHMEFQMENAITLAIFMSLALTQVLIQGKRPMSPSVEPFSFDINSVIWFDHILASILCLAITIRWDLHLRLPQVIFIWS